MFRPCLARMFSSIGRVIGCVLITTALAMNGIAQEEGPGQGGGMGGSGGGTGLGGGNGGASVGGSPMEGEELFDDGASVDCAPVGCADPSVCGRATVLSPGTTAAS